MVVGTPGRLHEMYAQKGGYLSKLGSLRFIVIDEADRMVAPGAFPELKTIFNAIQDQEKEAGEVGHPRITRLTSHTSRHLVLLFFPISVLVFGHV